MSNKEKRPYLQVYTMADAIAGGLRQACERVEIAGSLRRRKPFCADIEIVAIPKPVLNLLGEPSGMTEIDALLARWPVTLTKNGAKYKQFLITGTSGAEYQVDLFLPTFDTWGCVYMIRTGSGDFSKRMVTSKSQGGYKPDRYSVSEGRVWENGKALDTPEEADVFKLWNMDFVQPEARV